MTYVVNKWDVELVVSSGVMRSAGDIISGQIKYLKQTTDNLETNMATQMSNTSAIISGMDNLRAKIDKMQELLDRHQRSILLQRFVILGKINTEEMFRLESLLDSPDEENHVIAQEIIKQLIK